MSAAALGPSPSSIPLPMPADRYRWNCIMSKAALPRFIVMAEFEVKPERMEDFLALACDDARCSVAHEPGCHTFDVAVDQADPNCVVFYEVYDDQAAFDAHLATPHLARFRAGFPDCVVEQKPIRILACASQS
jgi:quinol monooxygenase YgiN